MEFVTSLIDSASQHTPVWFLSSMMVVAAIIDGVKLKVPNWLTLPLILAGWVFSACQSHWQGEPWWLGLSWSLFGTAVGLALLLPAYAIGGMGAGDVKLLMGCGAWVHAEATLYAFCVGAIVGGLLAMGMVVWTGTWRHHGRQFFTILDEIVSVRDPVQLSTTAAARKSTMRLLPYGIPITIGALLYFAWSGMLI